MKTAHLISLVIGLSVPVLGARANDVHRHPRPLPLRWIQTLAIKDGERESCKPPRFNETELNLYFFKEARSVPEEGFAHRDWSVCYGVGYATMNGREVLRWELNLMGTGTLTWSDGRRQFFVCDDCLRQ